METRRSQKMFPGVWLCVKSNSFFAMGEARIEEEAKQGKTRVLFKKLSKSYALGDEHEE